MSVFSSEYDSFAAVSTFSLNKGSTEDALTSSLFNSKNVDYISPVSYTSTRGFKTLHALFQQTTEKPLENAAENSKPAVDGEPAAGDVNGSTPTAESTEDAAPKPVVLTREELRDEIKRAIQASQRKYWEEEQLKMDQKKPDMTTQSTVERVPQHVHMVALAWIQSAMSNVLWYLQRPYKIPKLLAGWKKVIKNELHHMWMGFKLLGADIATAWRIFRRVLQGETLSRRERRQLLRTTTDVFRLVPFSVFIIVPFMELALPFALKLFPQMLPSTFQDKFQREASFRRELDARLELASFLQDSFQSLAHKKLGSADTALELRDLLARVRAGERISNQDIIRLATVFNDELTLDNLSRGQLVKMCKYMGLSPFGTELFLRAQLRRKLNSIRSDDELIQAEGISKLSTLELRNACNARGMRSFGLTQAGYRRNLAEWIDLSSNKKVCIYFIFIYLLAS